MSLLKILRTSRTLVVAGAFFGIFTLSVQPSQATSLYDLFFNSRTPSVTANDKIFDTFLFISASGFGDASEQEQAFKDIQVTALIDGGNDPGPGLLYTAENNALSNFVVNVDGPYGCPPNLEEYKSVLLIAGGIGITPLISLFTDAVKKKKRRGTSSSMQKLQEIVLIWIVRNKQTLHLFEIQVEVCN